MTEAILPEPPLPADMDLSKLDGFMLDTIRLLGSELVALSTGDEFKAAVILWCRAWKQRPACSLPDNDKILASFAMLSVSRWNKVKAMALRGFVKCSDGRFYHLVLAADALRAWEASIKYAKNREADRERLERWREAKRTKRETGAGTESETLGETDLKRVSSEAGNADETSKTGRDGTGEKKEKTDYAFSGRIIRLTPDDLARWQKAYSAIPDLSAELTTLDAYYDNELKGLERGKWFQRCSSALGKRHQERVAEARKPKGGLYGGAMA